jgi:hypothetical protein
MSAEPVADNSFSTSHTGPAAVVDGHHDAGARGAAGR